MEDENDVLTYDLTPASKTVKLGSGNYVLREVSGEGGTAYQNAVNDAMIIVDGKVTGYRNMENVEALLVSYCLFTVRPENKDQDNKPVSASTIEKWPYRVRHDLFLQAQKLSSLGEIVTKESLIKERDRLNKRIEDFERAEAEKTKN